MVHPRTLVRRLRRAVLARRRLLAAVFAALAVGLALRAHAAPAPPEAMVLTAARDLPAGATVTADDLARVGFRPGSVPAGVVAGPGAAVGRTTVGPVRQGEPLTDVRLLGNALLDHYPGLVAAPVRIGDRAAVDLLRVGDRVDILAADPQGDGAASVVARDVPIIAIPPGHERGSGLETGALVLVAVPDAAAQDLAGRGVSSFLSVVLVR